MSKAVGWAVIIFLVLLAGMHPSALASLLNDALAVLQRAGNELSSFVSRL